MHKTKYYYKGVPLISYAEQNGLSYRSIITYVKKKLKEDNTQNMEVLIEKAIKGDKTKYYYKGVPLISYAEQNNLSYSGIMSYVKRKLKKDNTRNIEELIKEAIKTIKKDSIKYYYKGLTLIQYCEKNDLSYSSISNFLRSKLKEDNTQNIEELIEEAIRTIRKDNIKYYYKGIPLVKYAEQNNLIYHSIITYINRKLKENDIMNVQELIEEAIKKTQHKLKIDKLREIFEKLENEQIDSIDKIKDICNFLEIDFENVRDLINMNFSYNHAIKMIWFFYDEKLDNNYKRITYKKLKEILTLVGDLKKGTTDVYNIGLYNLFGIYKSGLYDSRNEMLLWEKNHINQILYSTCKKYYIEVNKNNFEDFDSEIKSYILAAVDKSVLNTPEQVFKYIDIVMKGRFKNYLKQYIKEKKSLSLNEDKYKNTSGEKPRSRMEFVAESNSLCKSQERTLFGSDMMKVLSTLSEADLSFVILKYQENHSDDYLATYFNLTTDEVKDKEKEILSLLRNNDNIKVLMKKVNN